MRQPRLARLQGQLHIGLHTQGLEDLCHLKAAAHPAGQALGRAEPQQRLSLPQHLARLRLLLAGDAGEGGGFARTIGADQGHALARPHLQTDPVDRTHPREMPHQRAHLQTRRAHAALPDRERPKARASDSRPEGDATITSMMTKPSRPRQ